MKYIFVDTNFFIQCHTFKNIPWKKFFDQNEPILLLIPAAVQIEIDRLKSDGNNRRSQRARAANSLLKDILMAENEKLIFNAEDPLVEITFSPPIESKDEIPSYLDITKVDNQIIAEVINYKNLNLNKKVFLLTHDTYPLITAKRNKIESLLIPDSWLLPPEPDTKDKRLAELEKINSELRKSVPEIIFTAKDDIGNNISELCQSISTYKELNEDQIESAIYYR